MAGLCFFLRGLELELWPLEKKKNFLQVKNIKCMCVVVYLGGALSLTHPQIQGKFRRVAAAPIAYRGSIFYKIKIV